MEIEEAETRKKSLVGVVGMTKCYVQISLLYLLRLQVQTDIQPMNVSLLRG
jgi:hypothetical protein